MFPSGCVVCDATGGPRNAERESVVGRAEARIDRPQPAIERVVRRCRAAELGEQHASHRPPRDDRRRRADLEVREDPVPPHRAVKDEQVAAGAQRAQRWRQARDVRRVHDRHASARQPPRERRAISRVWHRERRDPPAPPRACGSRRHRDELDACEAPEPGPQDAHSRARRHHQHRVRPHPIEHSDPAAGIAVRVGEQHEIDAIGGLTREVTRDVDQDRAASLGDQERALHAARPPASRAPAGGTCAEEAHGDHRGRSQQLACQARAQHRIAVMTMHAFEPTPARAMCASKPRACPTCSPSRARCAELLGEAGGEQARRLAACRGSTPAVDVTEHGDGARGWRCCR